MNDTSVVTEKEVRTRSGWEKCYFSERASQVYSRVIQPVTARTYHTDAFCCDQSLQRCGKRLMGNHFKLLLDRRARNYINGIEGYRSYAKQILYNYRVASKYRFLMYLKEIE